MDEQQLPWLEVVDDLPRFATISDAVPSRALSGDDERRLRELDPELTGPRRARW